MKTPQTTSGSKFLLLLGIVSSCQVLFTAKILADEPTPSSTAEETVQLSPFEVKATSAEDGYLTKESNSSQRIAQKYIDTTQTISVLNSAYISDLNIQDTRRLFENMPNVYQGSQDQSNRVWVRGTEVDAIYVDGVIGSQRGEMPMQFYDRVEMVHGPASAAFGIGQPGGVINFVTKAPTGRTDTTIETGIGDYNNYLASIDTEGKLAKSRLGTLSYRAVGYWEKGGYEIQNEKHRGAGAQLALRDELNSTTRANLNIQFSNSSLPATDNPFILYSNQVAYTWLMCVVGNTTPGGGNTGIPVLPNSKPYPAGGSSLGSWAGGDLLPQGANAFPNNYGGKVTENFRISFTLEKSFLDNALTIRNTATYEWESIDDQYMSWTGGYYVDPVTNVPFNQEVPPRPYPDNVYGPVSDIAISLLPLELWNSVNSRNENLDIDYRNTFFGVNVRASVGADMNESTIAQPAEWFYKVTNPDGSPLYSFMNHPKDINIRQYPVTNISSYFSHSWAWGGYVNLSLGFFKDKVTVELGDRRDAGGGRYQDVLNNAVYHGALQHSKGAPRESIRYRPLPWLSLYALRAEHDDPPQIIQRYNLFNPGINLAALEAKYHNFNNPITYIPKGVLKEAGIKAEFLNGNIVVSADYFRFTTAGGISTNIMEDHDPNSPTFNSSVVEDILQNNTASGGEVEIAGHVGKHLTFTGAYGITRGRYPDFADGSPNFMVPPSTTSLHAKYVFGVIHGFDIYILAGATRYGPFWDSQNPWVYYEKAQYLYDGGGGIRWDHGRQSLEYTATNIGGKIPFISPQTAYASGSSAQSFVKYKIRF